MVSGSLLSAAFVLGFLPSLGVPELVVLAIIVLLLFGNRLPNVMRSLGQSITEFKKGVAGIDEDPVTGSAHCALAPFWAAKLGRTTLTAFQASKRGGELMLKLDGERVCLGGQAVTVWEGHLV